MLAELAVAELFDNPNQPRIEMHDETIAAFTAAIADAGRFPQEAALTVRPRHPGGWEIIAGHHRAAAARQAGIATVWAFVKLLTDREALIQLVTSNNHAAMTAFEHGRAATALKAEGVAYHEYARMTGKPNSTVLAAVWAWALVQDYGGPTGPFKETPAVVLEAVSRIKDRAIRDQVMYVIQRDRPTQAIALESIRNVKAGKPVTVAFKAGRATCMRRIEAAREAEAEPVGGFGVEKVDANALSAWAAAGFSRSQAETALAFATYQAAVIEEYQARFGHMIKDLDGFAACVSRRREALSEEDRARLAVEEELARESKRRAS